MIVLIISIAENDMDEEMHNIFSISSLVFPSLLVPLLMRKI